MGKVARHCTYLPPPNPARQSGTRPLPYSQYDHIRTCLVQFSMKTRCPPTFSFIVMLFIYSIQLSRFRLEAMTNLYIPIIQHFIDPIERVGHKGMDYRVEICSVHIFSSSLHAE